MRLRIISNNIRKCLSRIIVPAASPCNFQNHFRFISGAYSQLVIILIIFLVTIWTIVSFVLTGAFDYSLTTQMGFGIRGNEIEYFKTNTCANSNEMISSFDQQTNLWTRVSDTVYIYSAYLDNRNYSRNLLLTKSNGDLSLIRIVGLIRMPPAREIIRKNPMQWLKIKDETFLGNKYYCRVFYENENGKMVTIIGHTLTHTIIEEGVKIFSAALFNCYVNLSILTNSNEIYIAIYPLKVENYPDKLIRVNQNLKDINNSMHSNFSISVCIRPLFGPMDDLPKLVEFLSYYSSLGITRFTFYDLSISPSVNNYLMNLSKTGKINVILKIWNLPTGNVSELWDFGTLAALNDCLYSNMRETRVVFVDIDEYIVLQGSTKTHFLHFLQRHQQYHQLLIRNTFFCKEFCPASNDSFAYAKNKMQWTILNCFTRTKKIWNADMRSKYIVNPRKVVSVGHHLVTKYVKLVDHRFNDKSHIVKSDVALLHHYRHCRPISTLKHPILNRLTVTDRTLIKYKQTLENSLPYVTFQKSQHKY